MTSKQKKARLAYLRTLSKEELLRLYYMQQEKKAKESPFKYGRGVFAECKGTRIKKRVRNTFSREEMGTCPQVLHAVRTGVHSVCVCKGWANKF